MLLCPSTSPRPWPEMERSREHVEFLQTRFGRMDQSGSSSKRQNDQFCRIVDIHDELM